MKTLLQIGCDPELFLFDKVQDRIVPACGIIGGSKESPIVLKNGGMVQLDGTVLEFGTPPVSPEGDNFSTALRQSLDLIRNKLARDYGDRYELRCGAIAGYDKEDITDNHEGLVVGCSPQYAIVGRNSPVKVQLEGLSSLSRKAVPVGGHIHFGFAENMDSEIVENYSALRFVNALVNRNLLSFMHDAECEYTEKRNSVMMFPASTPAIRIKPYGIEFRNLSSYWLADANIADLFSKLHKQAVSDCVADRKSRGLAVARDITALLTEVGMLASTQHKKYQGTLPLAY